MNAPRAKVMKLAEAMEFKLAEKDDDEDYGDDGWISDNYEELFDRMEEEVAELKQALKRWDDANHDDSKTHKRLTRNVLSEAADVANFAVMIADVCDALKEQLK